MNTLRRILINRLSSLTTLPSVGGLGWIVALWLGVGLTSCTDDNDNPRISGVQASVEAPILSFYIEDMDSNDLLADADGLSVFCKETGQPLPFTLGQDEVMLWQHREPTNVSVLTVTLPTPYHSTDDKEFVYTLDPTLAILTDGLEYHVEVKTFYDYNLRYEQANGGERTAIVDYKPRSISFGSHQLLNDTLHIIAEDGYPYLRVDGDTLHVQLRFPETAAPLPQLAWNAESQLWTGDAMQCRIAMDGRVIARPHETIATSHHSERVVNDEGLLCDSTYEAIDLCLPLPYIYGMDESYTHSYFRFTLSMQNPQLFGDDGEHALDLQFYQWEKDIQRSQINVWLLYLDGRKLDTPSYYISYPYHINLNWS